MPGPSRYKEALGETCSNHGGSGAVKIDDLVLILQRFGKRSGKRLFSTELLIS